MGSIGNLKLIAVTPENYWHLKNLGKAGDSFNDVVTRLLKKDKEQDNKA
jgi:predicted CopG family antitoxin